MDPLVFSISWSGEPERQMLSQQKCVLLFQIPHLLVIPRRFANIYDQPTKNNARMDWGGGWSDACRFRGSDDQAAAQYCNHEQYGLVPGRGQSLGEARCGKVEFFHLDASGNLQGRAGF